jgi:hypothetical protein
MTQTTWPDSTCRECGARTGTDVDLCTGCAAKVTAAAKAARRRNLTAFLTDLAAGMATDTGNASAKANHRHGGWATEDFLEALRVYRRATRRPR